MKESERGREGEGRKRPEKKPAFIDIPQKTTEIYTELLKILK